MGAQLLACGFASTKLSQLAFAAGEVGEAAPRLEEPVVDFSIDTSWNQRLDPRTRMRELVPPEEPSDRVVRRLLVPRRSHDREFLRQLDVDNLRVDLWPHRQVEPHLHVRIFTDAFEPAWMATPQHFWARWLGPSDRQWLLLLQAEVHLPRSVALMRCGHKWSWAAFNESMMEEAASVPFRVLEVACPKKAHSFLMPMLPEERAGQTGSNARRDIFIRGCRFAFLVMLIIVCIAQVILLLICITMLIVQMGMQRQRPAVV